MPLAVAHTGHSRGVLKGKRQGFRLRVNGSLELCLLATSVGPLLYSLQHLPFHLTELFTD